MLRKEIRIEQLKGMGGDYGEDAGEGRADEGGGRVRGIGGEKESAGPGRLQAKAA